MEIELDRRPFNADEYHRLAEVGILSEEDRVELIEGEIIKVTPITPVQAACVMRLTEAFVQRVAQLAIVSVKNPIRLNDYSEPEPDICLLRRRGDLYASEIPTPNDALLVIEVADLAEDYNRDVMAPLYARAGIPEVWLAVVQRNHIEAYSQPKNGSYQTVRIVTGGESLSPTSFPDLVLTAEEILG
jgi:Uma2 family endonuclease